LVSDEQTGFSGITAIPVDAVSVSEGPSRRWRALDRDAKVALVGITLLVAGAIAVRAWFMVSYRPAFLGFGDSHEYVLAAATSVFRDVQHPAGYPLFLVLVHYFSDRLSFTIFVQHAIGVATGVLLYKSVRRTGAPAWLGLIPAAVVFFGGIRAAECLEPLWTSRHLR
jgi:hypothetical protein